MDALSMMEANEHLTYRSKNEGRAHMCGHDGHVTCLVAFVPQFLKNADFIPSDKVVRLLFQPSEEGPKSGAEKMVIDGCLNEVDEVYGFHQWPTAPLGELWCKQGPVMSEGTTLNIKIIGTSGHGSEPEKVKDSLRAAIKFYNRALAFIDQLKLEKKDKFICTLPVFQAGERFNVISESVFIAGTIRSFEEGLRELVLKEFTDILEDIKKRASSTNSDQIPTALLPSTLKPKPRMSCVWARKCSGKINPVTESSRSEPVKTSHGSLSRDQAHTSSCRVPKDKTPQ